MIKTYYSDVEESVFNDRPTKKVPSVILKRLKRKLVMLNAANTLNDLKIPPSNRLEKLSGNRAGQYSIRVNDQYRLCFKFINGNAYDVEFTDYHS
jgi:proteic killer suppression protein